jgi:hypothetical protein
MFGFVFFNTVPLLATTIVFSERALFEQLVPVAERQGFEQEFDTAAAVSFPGFTVTEDSSFANVKSRTDYVSAGDRSLGFTWNGDRTLTFVFNPPIDAFAADILDFGTCCGATILTVTSDTGEVNETAATGVNRPRGNLQFFGVVTDQPFSTLTMTSDQNSDNDLIVFDELMFRVVPEPAANVMLLGCLAMLTCRRRRRS